MNDIRTLLETAQSKVLDVGCGQGRDALFIARRGRFVTAIDLSPSGIRDLQKDAASEGLTITTEVADIRDYKSKCRYDIILIDRTLHMLALDDRIAVLRNLLALSRSGTHLLIADERSNIPAFKAVLDESCWIWTFSMRLVGDDARFVSRPGQTSPPFPGHEMREGQKLRGDWFPTIYKRMCPEF